MTSLQPTDDAGTAPADGPDADVFVIGDGPVGEAITRRLREADAAATLIDRSIEPTDAPGRRLDPDDASALEEAGLAPSSTVFVATDSDSRNLLIAQLVRVRFDVARVHVVANEPDRVRILADAGHDPLCVATTLADALVARL